MADIDRAWPSNAPGSFWVDESCIDCDACRLIAPATFRAEVDHSIVHRQPDSTEEKLAAARALVSCPTSSIGSDDTALIREASRSLPYRWSDDVWFCGYTSSESFGARSWLIMRPEGNVLVDSPRFAGPLVRSIERLGGVALIVLTHRDDVADHAAFARHFGAERWLHARDVTGSTRDVENQPEGDDEIGIVKGLRMIPTPGHTAGHAVYLWRDAALFSGDHLWWSPRLGRLTASRSVCWYSWEKQLASLERLLDYEFRQIFPGHGRPVELEPSEVRAQLRRIIEGS